MVKGECCTCPVKPCFRKLRITEIFFLYCWKTLKVWKAPKELMYWLCGQVSGNIPIFFLKLQQLFFMSKYFPSSKLWISLVLRNLWLLHQSDSFSAEINCVSWIWVNAANWQKLAKWHFFVFIITFYIDCIFLSCHVRVSEWIHILQLP